MKNVYSKTKFQNIKNLSKSIQKNLAKEFTKSKIIASNCHKIYMMTTKKFILTSFFVLFFLTTIFFYAFFLPFKTQYISTFSQISNQNGVDLSLALAIAKAESKFDKNAKSAKGAIGLMQIKLETANYVLQKNGGDQLTEEQLFLPQNNILCGIKYIAYLQTRFEDEDSIICAYNAGETVVASWLKNKTYSQNGKTLDLIPFKETKNYLSKVKFNRQIYQNFFHYN